VRGARGRARGPGLVSGKTPRTAASVPVIEDGRAALDDKGDASDSGGVVVGNGGGPYLNEC